MLKVVVVEDEELVRKGIVLTVDWAGAGCAVVGEAANGEEGLEVIRRYRPDLIVTDIRMPKLDGIEMLRRLREEGNRAHVVFLTAYSDFSYAQSALKLGAADYLLKPQPRRLPPPRSCRRGRGRKRANTSGRRWPIFPSITTTRISASRPWPAVWASATGI